MSISTRLTLAAPLALLATTAGAQPAPAPSLAYDIVSGLTTEVGPRLTGSPAEARARDWAVARLKALGFANVHVETYTLPGWERGVETADVVAPFPQRLMLTALGASGATPAEGLTGDVLAFASLDALKAAPAEAVRGRIVYVTHAMKPAQDASSYGFYGPTRFEGPSIAAAKGAALYLLRSLGTDGQRRVHTGVTDWPQGVAPIPAAALSNTDADNLERMLAHGSPVRLHVTLTPRLVGPRPSGNVIAEVPGSDPAAGIIVIGGHLDSWDLGTGAIDDGAGVAITTAAAKRLLDEPRPRRTIRVVWWGSEEVGGNGADAYFAAHHGENHVLAAESDLGADRVWRTLMKLPDAAKPLAARLSAALGAMGIPTGDAAPHGGADIEKLMATGVAVVDLSQDATRYFDIHHTQEDTLDKIDPAQMQQNVEAWVTMLRLVANAPEDLTPAPKPAGKSGN